MEAAPNNHNKKQDNKCNDIIVSFETFLNRYEELFRKNINREQSDSKIFSKKAKTPRKLIKYGRKNYLLDDELLTKYIYLFSIKYSNKGI